jgi:hypothetical protein
MKQFCLLYIILIISGCSSVSKYETPNYEVVKKEGNIEIRSYPSFLKAEVRLEGEREQVSGKAFSILFSYITGKNTGENKISMTIPVLQEKNNKANAWDVSFLLPKNFNLLNAPKPKDDRIKLIQTKQAKLVAISFSGFWSEKNMQKHKALLDEFVKKEGLKIKAGEVFAFYNSPYTLPWLRRNEVLYFVME